MSNMEKKLFAGRSLLSYNDYNYKYHEPGRDSEGNVCNVFVGNCGRPSTGLTIFLVLLFLGVIIFAICMCRCHQKRNQRRRNAFMANNAEMTTAIANSPVVITSATHQTTNAGYPPQNIGVHTAPYPTGTQSGFQPFPMPQPTINTGFQPMPQPGAGYTPYPPNNNSAPYPPAVPTIQNTDAMNPPSYDQVVNAEPYQKQDAYNPNFKSQ